MKRLRRKLVAVAMMSAMILSGCGEAMTNDSSEAEDSNTLEIGMCFDSFVIERWQKDRDVFVDTATSLGATVNVQNANGDVTKQIEQIQYFIDKNVDCLVIIPIDGGALTEVVNKAKAKNIPVVCYDRLIRDVNADLYISFDNEMVGRMLGDALVKQGSTRVVMICGPHTDNNVPMVEQGFRAVMEEKGIEILDMYNCEGWKAELGSSYVYENIDLIKQSDGIMCGNDDIATAVIRALAVSQLAGVIPVVGQDADLTACQHIVEGTQNMTVYKPVNKLAEQAAQLSVQLAKGNPIETTEFIDDGTTTIPYVAVEPVAVDAANIDEVIIEGGFHSREDVYLNVAK
ncbi:substrate-binding domain-containing protein [Pseudobutyrivibrio sp.]|uniref:substrate-binding domain-containing protein n=1 Tax=Pseudobutyrivibrio sp. TaxID=2014367 RepID=UPI0025CE7D9C|nr:substrate-binding domain-containing protein [Pseudobutyrivibrio sp.]MBR5650045.1 substrate-binding domain-containing protein [Pseudobutyrivibrio sp.]